MIRVITYGTFDLLHYGHIRLLERAKALGDYLIVGITSDDFDKSRGKINVHQSLMERIEAIRSTGLADKIIVEEYEGQKIDDIQRYEVDIFTVGSDWLGKFDYLNEYCKVIYLERTQGISSTDIRNKNTAIKLGFAGDSEIIKKFLTELSYVNGIIPEAIYTTNKNDYGIKKVSCYSDLLNTVDAVYLCSMPDEHFNQIKEALALGKHVLCESPIALSAPQCIELYSLAEDMNCILMDSIKTAYSTAYSRLLALAKGGKIGDIISIDATATSLRDCDKISQKKINKVWNSICAWGPTVLLPIFQLLGVHYKSKQIVSKLNDDTFDLFTKIDFIYEKAVATIKVGKGIKSEGELIISGTKGYIYVPAPWWKTDYFEIRYENSEHNKRYFYQLDGEGIRYELVAFVKAIETSKSRSYIDVQTSQAICTVIEDFYSRIDFVEIC